MTNFNAKISNKEFETKKKQKTIEKNKNKTCQKGHALVMHK